VAGDDESPFARIPEPGIYEVPSAITPAAEVAAYGAIARAALGRPRAVRLLIGLGFLMLLVGGVVLAAVGWLLFDDDPDSTPETPPVPSSITQTAPSTAPVFPAPEPAAGGSPTG
jgi:hypothetical protein